MKKNKIILWILLFALILWAVLFFLVNKKEIYFRRNVEHIQKIYSELDEMILSWDIQEDSLSLNTWVLLEEYDNILQDFSTWFNELSLDDLKQAYWDSVIKWDNKKQIEILERIYKITNNNEYIYILLDKSLKIYDFPRALDYIKILRKDDPNLENYDISSFFYILFNWLDLNLDNLWEIIALLKAFHNEKRLTDDEYIYYNSIVTLSKLDILWFKSILSEIQVWGPYDKFITDINDSFQQFESYRDVSDYYIYWLISYTMLQYWYFGIAQKYAITALKYNENYILPNQIMAYSSFILNNYELSKEYFKKLIEIDKDNQDMYKFYLWISQYWAGNYEDSIVFLSQIKSWDYLKDSLRYMILSYHQIGDNRHMIDCFTQLLDIRPLSQNDYYTFFDIMFYEVWEQWSEFTLFQDNSDLVLNYMLACQKDLPKNSNFVCIYGKWWYYVAMWEETKTERYLLYLSRYYPRDYIFKELWDIYLLQQQYDKAKKSYINSIVYSDDEDFKKLIKNKLLYIILKSDKK